MLKNTRIARLLQCLALLAALVPAAGCDWLSPSGSASRSSPVIDSLAVVPVSVFCGPKHPLSISFGYNDPQEDYYRVVLAFQQVAGSAQLLRMPLWTEMDLKTLPGKAIYGDFYFECGADPAGVWKLTVTVEDERGHQSNELTTDVTLISSR